MSDHRPASYEGLRAEDAEERGQGICRTCLAPIWNEGGTVDHAKRAEGWSDRNERGGDSLICFKASHYRHEPLTGREAAIYDRAFDRGCATAVDGLPGEGPWVEIGGERMTQAQFDAARHPLLTPDPGPCQAGDEMTVTFGDAAPAPAARPAPGEGLRAAVEVYLARRGKRCNVCTGRSPSWDGHDKNPPYEAVALDLLRAALAAPDTAGQDDDATATVTVLSATDLRAKFHASAARLAATTLIEPKESTMPENPTANADDTPDLGGPLTIDAIGLGPFMDTYLNTVKPDPADTGEAAIDDGRGHARRMWNALLARRQL